MFDEPISVGFTGTQKGMSDFQKNQTSLILKTINPKSVHHGCCIGADNDFHLICLDLKIPIFGYPSNIISKTMDLHKEEFVVLKDKEDPLIRNKSIVNATDLLIATPYENFEIIRSGTWSTVRFARKLQKQIEIILRNE